VSLSPFCCGFMSRLFCQTNKDSQPEKNKKDCAAWNLSDAVCCEDKENRHPA
jgi:hypothetical protein